MDEIKEELDLPDIADSMDVEEFLNNVDPVTENSSIQLQTGELNILPAPGSFGCAVGPSVPLPMCEPKLEPTSFAEHVRSHTIDTVPAPMFDPKIEPETSAENDHRFEVRSSQEVPVPMFEPKIEPTTSSQYDHSTQLEDSRTPTVPVPMIEPKNEPDYQITSEYENTFLVRPQVPLPMFEPKSESENTAEYEPGLEERPLTMPTPMCVPKLEPETTSEYDLIQQTVPAPMCIPKVEPDMIDCFITQPETLDSFSTAPEEESTSKVLPEDDIVSISDDETPLGPGPSTSQNTRKRRKLEPTTKYCGVKGCGATSISRSDGLAIFRLPLNLTRRRKWLKKIDRMDLLNAPSIALHICEKHFDNSDIVKTAKTASLKVTAVPLHFLPSDRKEHKSVQTRHIMFDNFSQTDYTNMDSKAVQVNFSEPGTFNTNENKKLLAECKKRLRSIENGAHKTQIHAFNTWCDKFLPGQLAKIAKGQATLKASCTGNRYDLTIKALSLNLYYTNAEAYNLLFKAMRLPNSKSLKRIDVPVSTAYNEDIMTALKMKVDCMSEREKYCSVVVDLMKLRASLSYDINKDRITGLHEVNGCQAMEPAQYAMVILARGLLVNWSQPIAFALLSETKRHSQVSEWIDIYLTKLLDIGLKIKSYVPNFKSDLLNEAQIRSVSVDKPYFFVNDVKIYYIFDVPDLLKELRDTFMDYRFTFKRENGTNGVAAITHLTDLLQHDIKKKLRLVPKLTLEHLYPKDAAKNQVRYAAQLLSRSVATALEMRIDFHRVDEELGRGTVYFLLLINNLFDTLNSSSLKGERFKRAYRGDVIQEALLKKSLDFFENFRLMKGNSNNTKKQIKSQLSDKFQITITSVLLLFEDLKLEGHEYLFTRYLHLEVAKKFFKAIKTKALAAEPSSKQFSDLFRESYLTHILKPSNQRNSSRDLAKFLIEMNEKEDQNDDEDSASNLREVPLADSPQSSLQSVPGAAAIFSELHVSREYNVGDICKILLNACLKHHDKCDGLKVFVDSFNSAYSGNENNDWEMQTLETISPVYFVSFVETMEKAFCEAYESLETNINIGMATYERIKDTEFAPPCPCFPKNYLISLFIRLRILMIVNYNTDVYRQNNFNGKYVLFPKLTSIYA